MNKLLVSLLLAATAVSSFAEQRVADELKDPSSAQFRKVKHFPNGNSCGEVNAKNSYGGYVGFKSYMVYDGHVHINQSSLEFNCKTAEDPTEFYAMRCESYKKMPTPSLWARELKMFCKEPM